MSLILMSIYYGQKSIYRVLWGESKVLLITNKNSVELARKTLNNQNICLISVVI